MNRKRFLKWILLFGGILEIIIGIFMMMLHPILQELEIETVPIFVQMAGTFLLGYGVLLVFASKAIKRYRIVPIVNVVLRFIMVGFSIIQLPQYPNFLVILLPAMTYDVVWSIIVLFLMNGLGFLRLQQKNNQ